MRAMQPTEWTIRSSIVGPSVDLSMSICAMYHQIIVKHGDFGVEVASSDITCKAVQRHYVQRGFALGGAASFPPGCAATLRARFVAR